MVVTEHIGDIFKVPENSVLIHACNCQGVWGSGVAKGFADKFPAAFEVYRDYCLTPDTAHHKKWLVGTTLLIPPQDEDVPESGSYWIACLFTSLGFGGKADKPDAILEATRKSMMDLKKRLREKERQVVGLSLYDKLYAVRINSARFNVAWPRSKRVLEQSLVNIRIMNNIDVISEKEKAAVLSSMKADGFDTENVANFDVTGEGKAAAEDAEKPKQEQQEEEEEEEEEEEAIPAKSKSMIKKRKHKNTEVTGEATDVSDNKAEFDQPKTSKKKKNAKRSEKKA